MHCSQARVFIVFNSARKSKEDYFVRRESFKFNIHEYSCIGPQSCTFIHHFVIAAVLQHQSQVAATDTSGLQSLRYLPPSLLLFRTNFFVQLTNTLSFTLVNKNACVKSNTLSQPGTIYFVLHMAASYSNRVRERNPARGSTRFN